MNNFFGASAIPHTLGPNEPATVREKTIAAIVGDRLRELREHKKPSQGNIEQRRGLLRCQLSRVENGHTVRAVETLEKFASALEVPVY